MKSSKLMSYLGSRAEAAPVILVIVAMVSYHCPKWMKQMSLGILLA
jgi:hypothetical protein